MFQLDTIPLLTTKKLNFEAIARELLWFISGSTDSRKLADMGVHIWDANGSTEFLKLNGFHDRDGESTPLSRIWIIKLDDTYKHHLFENVRLKQIA